MRMCLRKLSDFLQPRAFSIGHIRSDAMLKPLVLMVIIIVAGPDLFAFAELTTLLELLGATLFVIAFAVGFQMLGLALLERLRGVLVPLEYSMLVQARSRPFTVMFGVLYVARHCLLLGLVLVALCMESYAAISQAVRLFE